MTVKQAFIVGTKQPFRYLQFYHIPSRLPEMFSVLGPLVFIRTDHGFSKSGSVPYRELFIPDASHLIEKSTIDNGC